jgi:hypothetical protein
MQDFKQDSDLITRLRKLERSQSRYRAAFLCTAALAAVLCITGAKRKADDLIQAKTFEVVNDGGKVLARLSSLNGSGVLTTFRPDGNSLVTIGSSTDNSGRIDVYNATGKATVTLSATTVGSGNVAVNGPTGDPAVTLGTTTAKNGGVWIYNNQGKIVGQITAQADTGDGVAEIFDSKGAKIGHLP